jgi:ABC-type sugar transport system substrate-binding protein
MKRRILLLMLVLILTPALFAACGQSESAQTESDGDVGSTSESGAPAGFTNPSADIRNEEFTIAFIPLSTAQENVPILIQGMEDALAVYPNAKLQTYDAQFDPNTQISLINECVTQGVNGVIVYAADATALNSTIKEAEEAGVVVFTMNTGCTGDRTAHILNSDYKAGLEAAEYLAGVAPADSNVVILDVVAELKPTCTMGTAFEDFMADTGTFNDLEGIGIPMTSVENSVTAMRDLLTKYQDIDIVYTVNDNCAIGAAQAIEAAGRAGDGIIIWGYEGTPAALDAIQKGTIYGTSYSDPYNEGLVSVSMLLFCINTGISSHNLGGFGYTPMVELATVPVTKENIASVIKSTHWDLSSYGY